MAVGCLTPAAVTQAVAMARKAGPVEEVMNPAPQVGGALGLLAAGRNVAYT